MTDVSVLDVDDDRSFLELPRLLVTHPTQTLERIRTTGAGTARQS